MTLSALEAQIRRELGYIDYPPVSWMPQRGLEDHALFDVVIVGAGQSGLAAAFGLMREQVRNILVLDRAPEGLEGPWTTFARMVTLRTPKMVSGLDFGMPALTFRAWYETQWGHDALERSRQDPARTLADLFALVSPRVADPRPQQRGRGVDQA